VEAVRDAMAKSTSCGSNMMCKISQARFLMLFINLDKKVIDHTLNSIHILYFVRVLKMCECTCILQLSYNVQFLMNIYCMSLFFDTKNCSCQWK
jgi:hypothetical protein